MDHVSKLKLMYDVCIYVCTCVYSSRLIGMTNKQIKSPSIFIETCSSLPFFRSF